MRSLQKHDDARIVALCDANPAALQSAAKAHSIERTFTDYRALLEANTTDAVCSTAHSDELAAVARENKLILTCHYNQRTHDHIATLRWMVQQGLLGDVYHINAAWMARHTSFMFDAQTTWRQSRAKSGDGIFIGRGSHLLDAALFFGRRRESRHNCRPGAALSPVRTGTI